MKFHLLFSTYYGFRTSHLVHKPAYRSKKILCRTANKRGELRSYIDKAGTMKVGSKIVIRGHY